MVIEHSFLCESIALNDSFLFPCPQIPQVSTQNYYVLALNPMHLSAY